MNDLFEMVLAAKGREESDYSWLIPLVVFAIWIVGSVFKAMRNAKETRQEDTQKQVEAVKRPSTLPQEEPRYKYKALKHELSPRERPIPQVAMNKPGDLRQRQRRTETPKKQPGPVSSLKAAVRKAVEEAYSQQAQRQIPKPARTQPPKRVPLKEKTVSARPKPAVEHAATIMEHHTESIKSGLSHKESLRNAIVYSEILSKPIALRESQY